MPALVTEQRPRGFNVGVDSGDILFTLQRRPLSEDEKTLGGTQGWIRQWTVLRQVVDGKASSDETLSCVLVRSDSEAVVVNLDIEPVEKPEGVAWVDPIHKHPG